jgi:hypothetical protein
MPTAERVWQPYVLHGSFPDLVQILKQFDLGKVWVV